MISFRTSAVSGILIAALFGISLSITGCRSKDSFYYQGYAEGEYVLVAAPYAGRLEKLSVQRGQSIESGALLFVLEQDNEIAQQKETLARLQNAEARHANLTTALRASEIEAVRAELAQAESDFHLAKLERERQEKLYSEGIIPKSRLDEARALYENRKERVAGARAKHRLARSSLGRDKEIAAAGAEVEAARAALSQTEWRLSQRSVHASVKGLVQDTYYSEGEWVPGGSPVISLLPPENLKMRFFVPEAVVGSLTPGQEVTAYCDGCSSSISAKISYISPNSEYTPPVIYSREQRKKMVFMIEAIPAPGSEGLIHPGQPLDVKLN